MSLITGIAANAFWPNMASDGTVADLAGNSSVTAVRPDSAGDFTAPGELPRGSFKVVT
jgi:hypothetical protein